MADLASMLPEAGAVRKGLASVLRKKGIVGGRTVLLRREPMRYSTTFPCEIVTCRIGRGRARRLFCKYTSSVNYVGHGHRGGIGYEAEVYGGVLSSRKLVRPRFYGGYKEPRTGQHWLFLEYLEGSQSISKLNDVSVMKRAARWIARFHVANESNVTTKHWRFLKRYDKDYYLGWVWRTSEFAGPLHKRFPWLRGLCARASELLAPLMAFRPTVIHGEYYPQNILFHRGQVCPIDWESAAIAEGLIDLATLTEGWRPSIKEACEKAYVRGRWPAGPPSRFKEALRAARLYVNFRWLGDNRQTTHSWDGKGYWRALKAFAEAGDSCRTESRRMIGSRHAMPVIRAGGQS